MDFTNCSGFSHCKVNSENTRLMCEICSKLKIKSPERRQQYCSVVFIANFEQVSRFFTVSIAGFEQIYPPGKRNYYIFTLQLSSRRPQNPKRNSIIALPFMIILKCRLIWIKEKCLQAPSKLINLIRYPIVGSCLSDVRLFLFE